MFFRIMVALALMATCGAAAAKERRLNPWPKAGVSTSYRQGMALLRSDQGHSVVVVGVQTPFIDAQGRASLVIFVDNRTGAPAAVTTATVTAADQGARPLPVLAIEQMAPAGFPIPDQRLFFARVAASIAGIDPTRYISISRDSPSASPAAGTVRPIAMDDGDDAISELTARARVQPRHPAEIAAFGGLISQWVASGATYATGATVQIAKDTKAFDLKIVVGGDAHWFTFQTL